PVPADQPAQADPGPQSGAPASSDGGFEGDTAEYYKKVAQKIADLAGAGDHAALDAMKENGLKPNAKGKVGHTWKGKTANSKKLLALHDAALQHAL
ncbi:hypothetical protein, partial [Escherichia coli]|uniref:hypothetical protein n=1 Tax=Escherichia coli TaxID=562 RepID=UPI00197CDA52